MSETADYTPAHWAGHDFSSARSYYDSNAGRSYATAVAANVTTKELVHLPLRTSSPSPLIIMSDVTGSMGTWPGVMFGKLPYLELEGQTYLGKEMEIAWLAVGDAYSDKYPLQSRPFTKGVDLKAELEKLVIEMGGGGTKQESYQLGAYYALHQIETPAAVRPPVLIMIGDEAPYSVLTPSEALLAGVKESNTIQTLQIFEELRKRMSVYLIRKPYEPGKGDGLGAIDQSIHTQWAGIPNPDPKSNGWVVRPLIPEDHIAYLADPARVVDVIFGILARETGRISDFRKEIEGRQTADQVQTVYRALKTIHSIAGTSAKPSAPALPEVSMTGKSTMHRPTMGKKSKGLLG